VRDDDGTRRRVLNEGDEVSFGPRRPVGRRRPGRLLIACGVVLAAAAAAAATLVIGHGSNPPRARPASTGSASTGAVSTVEAGPRLLGVRGSWELFGYGDGGVVRIQFASGRITQTAVPVRSGDWVSLVVGPHEAIISRLDYLPGYLVPDGRPARPLSGVLGTGGIVLPGPQPGTAWVQAGPAATSMPLVRMDGTEAGVSAPLPPGAAGTTGAFSDGRGGVLVIDYSPTRSTWDDVRPGGFQPIAGNPAAVGPTRWLVIDCQAGHRCSSATVDPATGAQHTLPGPSAELLPATGPGVIAPDGSAAAIAAASGDRVSLHLVNLVSGSDQQIPVSLDAKTAADQTLAWSPDSRWLFVVTGQGKLAVVDARTGHVESLGVSLPSLSLIAVRNLASGCNTPPF
jgi:hypothetical protein